MKKLFFAVLFTGAAFNSFACDVCGSGVSNYNPFLFPHLAKSHINLSYFRRSFNEIHEGHKTGSQHYQSLVVGGQYSLTKKIQVTAFVPIQLNQLNTQEGLVQSNGLGDIIILANYKLLDKRGTIRHNILVGGGIKLPTGKFSPVKSNGTQQAFQIGSGSVDYLINGSYRATYKKWVFSAMGSYKYNTPNSQRFRFGDVLTTGITTAYRVEKGSISLTPYLQIIGEQQMQNAHKNVLQHTTGGKALYTGAGLDVNTRVVAMGFIYQLVPAQNLQKGMLLAQPRLSAHVSFML